MTTRAGIVPKTVQAASLSRGELSVGRRQATTRSIVLTSSAVVAPKSVVNSTITKALEHLAETGIPVGLVSNHVQPVWFGAAFPKGGVEFLQRRGRQDGSIIADLGSRSSIPTHDFIVLGADDDDVRMAKNGGAVLVSAGWGPVSRAAGYGISVSNGSAFAEVVNLVGNWPGTWFFEGAEPWYSIRALANVSGKSVTTAQTAWAAIVVATVKNGGVRLPALLTVAARSLLMSGLVNPSELMFGLYPSSASTNNDSEVLSDFSHRLRTVTSRVRFAKKGEPLLVRHKKSTKRSRSDVVDRADPAQQIESLHVNPFYRDKISGRHIVMLDDCTTYGVSFGVASSLLRKAGAASVSCVALGKFGEQLRYYEIDIRVDPFGPVGVGSYSIKTNRRFVGNRHDTAQAALQGLIK